MIDNMLIGAPQQQYDKFVFAEGSQGIEQHCHPEPVRTIFVGTSLVQQTANQLRRHSEPVLRLVWESPSSL